MKEVSVSSRASLASGNLGLAVDATTPVDHNFRLAQFWINAKEVSLCVHIWSLVSVEY